MSRALSRARQREATEPDGTSINGDIRNTAVFPVGLGDTFFGRNKLPPIGIPKVDVEGFERRVIQNLRNRLRRDRPFDFVKAGETMIFPNERKSVLGLRLKF